MEPKHNSYQPSTELPQPQENSATATGQGGAEAHAPAPERSTTPPATPAGQQPLQPVAAQAASPSANAAGPAAASTTSTTTAALMADDVDLIEKEWVVKAKEIVAQTKDDPYKQNQAMTQVKADYLKKRYNKDLKVGNEK